MDKLWRDCRLQLETPKGKGTALQTNGLGTRPNLASLGSIWSKLVPGRGVSQREAKVGIYSNKKRFPSGSVATGTKASAQRWAEKFNGKLVCLSRNGKRYLATAHQLRRYARGMILITEDNIPIHVHYYQDRKRLHLATEADLVLSRLAKKTSLEGMK